MGNPRVIKSPFFICYVYLLSLQHKSLSIHAPLLNWNLDKRQHCVLIYNFNFFFLFKNQAWTSLVAQWLRIRLPMQGTRVRALVQEDPTCRGVAKPVRHNY